MTTFLAWFGGITAGLFLVGAAVVGALYLFASGMKD